MNTAAATRQRQSRTWAEINLTRIQQNARQIAARTNGAALLSVVKADAYGHGLLAVARACAAADVRHLGVAGVPEAETLRQAGISAEIYLFSPFLPEEAAAIVRLDVIPFVSSREQLDALTIAAESAPFPARCFLKIDTGMGRSGASPAAAAELWQSARARSNRLRVTGLAMHFSSADEPEEIAEPASVAQLDVFADFLANQPAGESADDGRGGPPGVWLSVCNSPGLLRFSDLVQTLAHDFHGVRGILCRAGLLLYGIAPYENSLNGTGILPALSWRARVTLVRDLPAGATIGYGQTATLSRASRIATVACGYGDGYPRRLSNSGFVLLRGRRIPIVGRVSMDQMQVDATDVDGPPIAPGEVVTLLGMDHDAEITAAEIAAAIETTPHEPTCQITQRVPRLYTG